MSQKKFCTLMLLLVFLFASSSCSKKQVVRGEAEELEQKEPVTEELTKEIPPIEEEKVEEEPVVEEKKMPLLGDVFFDFDKFNLKEEAKRTLEGNADELKNFPSVEITIEGHCDERGTEAYNLALGEKRAKAAKNYLIAIGVDQGRIKIISYGEERPFDPRHNEEAWAKNRRAHFVIRR